LGVLDAQVFDTRVFSPFDGVVIEKAAEVGEIVAPISIGGSMARGSIVTIAERKSFQAEVDVAEKYIARIRPGMRASIDIDAFTGKPLAGKVLRILPRANRSKATVQVRVTILDIDTHLEVLPDMGLRVKFLPDDAPAGAETSTAKSASVPASAVQSGEAGAFVWVVAGGKALKTPVVQGAARGESVEIKSGLSEGQKVVIKGADALRRDAQTVRVTE
jgi:RND family efflux transporter MFP subunit